MWPFVEQSYTATPEKYDKEDNSFFLPSIMCINWFFLDWLNFLTFVFCKNSEMVNFSSREFWRETNR